MDEVTLPELGFTIGDVIELLTTTGVEFGINVVTALLIFVVGRWAIGLVMRGLRTLMQKQEVDKTLETFVSNLVYSMYAPPGADPKIVATLRKGFADTMNDAEYLKFHVKRFANLPGFEGLA